MGVVGVIHELSPTISHITPTTHNPYNMYLFLDNQFCTAFLASSRLQLPYQALVYLVRRALAFDHETNNMGYKLSWRH